MTAAALHPPHVALLSLEPWDDVWRRNQHLASRLAGSGRAASVVFVEPPVGGLAPRAVHRGESGVDVITSPLLVPRRIGGHRVTARMVGRLLSGIDLLWINDPVAGAALAGRLDVPVVYDVTDDWRSMPQGDRDRIRSSRAEDALARTAAVTVVCSTVLAERWRDRYGVQAILVPNGFDHDFLARAEATPLTGPGPHTVYVGTVHENRFDVGLLIDLATSIDGTVHVVGPHHLPATAERALRESGVDLVGPVPAVEVASWLVSADLLVCPHRVDAFTLSLDAIKAHEYLATQRPVVATPSCGFQDLTAPGLAVGSGKQFVAAARRLIGTGPYVRPPVADWATRAAQFADVLDSARSEHRR